MHMSDFVADHEKMEDDVEMDTGGVEVYVHNVEKAHSLWRQKNSTRPDKSQCATMECLRSGASPMLV